MKMHSKTSKGHSEMVTVGPTEDVKSLMETEFSEDDHWGEEGGVEDDR